MAIRADSRYAGHATALVTGRGGVTRNTIMPKRPGALNLTVTDYTWKAGDRLDLLAARQFGDDTMGWVIGQANPEILDWLSVAPGTIVRLPRGAA